MAARQKLSIAVVQHVFRVDGKGRRSRECIYGASKGRIKNGGVSRIAINPEAARRAHDDRPLSSRGPPVRQNRPPLNELAGTLSRGPGHQQPQCLVVWLLEKQPPRLDRSQILKIIKLRQEKRPLHYPGHGGLFKEHLYG